MTVPSRVEEWFPLSLRTPFEDLWPDPWAARLMRGLPDVFSASFVPPVDVAETEKQLVLTVEAPGMDEKDFDIKVTGHEVTLTGEKKVAKKKEGLDFRRVESRHGKFARSIELPTKVRTDEVDAVYSKGVLTIKLAKVEPKPVKKIKIRTK